MNARRRERPAIKKWAAQPGGSTARVGLPKFKRKGAKSTADHALISIKMHSYATRSLKKFSRQKANQSIFVFEMIDDCSDDAVSVKDLNLDLPSFLRLFSQRGRSIMWFLGAGASRAARIKTAWDMIWDFKRTIYRSHKGVHASALPDNSDWRVRKLIQRFFDEEGIYPPLNDPSEYSVYFKATYRSEKDRRRYIDNMVADAKPSFGHHGLAALMDKELCDILWTTNFDRVIEDAAAKRFGTTGKLSHGDLRDPETVRQAINDGRWPVYGKIHGDFQSVALKNTEDELSAQDGIMRSTLIDACRTRGLAVSGYSGRDASVMEAFRAAVDEGGFPHGLFWFQRDENEVFPGVADLIRHARSKKIEANLVSAQSFDEVISDLLTFLPQMEGEVEKFRQQKEGRRARIKPFGLSKQFPVIRTNALPVVSYPQLARLIDCDIGGYKKIRNVVESARVDAVTARIKSGVIAFGADSALKEVFKPFNINSWDTHPIIPERLRFESGERTLVREALLLALQRKSGLTLKKRRSESMIIAGPEITSARLFQGLRNPTAVAGKIEGTSIQWFEACGVRIDFRSDQLWLLLDPGIYIDWGEDAEKQDRDKAKEFVRERMAGRYNKIANTILDNWKAILIGEGETPITVNSVTNDGGIGAIFRISPVSGYSGRTK